MRKVRNGPELFRVNILICFQKFLNRGGRINAHEGNIRFREIVASQKPRYLANSTKKLEKGPIAEEIVNSILSKGGRFLRETSAGNGIWKEVPLAKAKKKVLQALREDAPDYRADQEEEISLISIPPSHPPKSIGNLHGKMHQHPHRRMQPSAAPYRQTQFRRNMFQMNMEREESCFDLGEPADEDVFDSHLSKIFYHGRYTNQSAPRLPSHMSELSMPSVGFRKQLSNLSEEQDSCDLSQVKAQPTRRLTSEISDLSEEPFRISWPEKSFSRDMSSQNEMHLYRDDVLSHRLSGGSRFQRKVEPLYQSSSINVYPHPSKVYNRNVGSYLRQHHPMGIDMDISSQQQYSRPSMSNRSRSRSFSRFDPFQLNDNNQELVSRNSMLHRSRSRSLSHFDEPDNLRPTMYASRSRSQADWEDTDNSRFSRRSSWLDDVPNFTQDDININPCRQREESINLSAKRCEENLRSNEYRLSCGSMDFDMEALDLATPAL